MRVIGITFLSSFFLFRTIMADRTYSIKCGTDMYMCGDGLTESNVCHNSGSDNNGLYIPKSIGDCKGMIDAINGGSPFGAKCPNNKGISHYVIYDGCNLPVGEVHETGGISTCTCPSGKCGPSECGGGTVGGDPHFRTHDGSMYSFHGECDLVMARSPSFGDGLGLDVHARTTMIGGTWSLVSNAVVRIGDDVFEVNSNEAHYMNGIVDAILPTTIASKFEISYQEEIVNDGETSIRRWYTIALGEDETIQISNYRGMISINVNANLLDTAGMLGSSSKAGLVGRDGKTMITDADEMGLHWQVNAEEPMLFHEIRAPQFPERCILPTRASQANRRLRLTNSENIIKAKVACNGVAGNLYDFCLHDVVISGDAKLANTYFGGVF